MNSNKSKSTKKGESAKEENTPLEQHVQKELDSKSFCSILTLARTNTLKAPFPMVRTDSGSFREVSEEHPEKAPSSILTTGLVPTMSGISTVLAFPLYALTTANPSLTRHSRPSGSPSAPDTRSPFLNLSKNMLSGFGIGVLIKKVLVVSFLRQSGNHLVAMATCVELYIQLLCSRTCETVISSESDIGS